MVDFNANNNRHYIKALAEVVSLKDRLQKMRYSKEKSSGLISACKKNLNKLKNTISGLQETDLVVSMSEFKLIKQEQKTLAAELQRLEVEYEYAVNVVNRLEKELKEAQKTLDFLENTVLEIKK